MDGKIGCAEKLYMKSPRHIKVRNHKSYSINLYMYGSVIKSLAKMAHIWKGSANVAPPSGEKLNYAITVQPKWLGMGKNYCRKWNKDPILTSCQKISLS